MEQTIIDCSTGDVSSVPMTDAEIAAHQRTQTEGQAQLDAENASRAAAAAAQQAAIAAQVQAAQALIETSSNSTQADAMKAFMRSLGLPL